MKLEKLSDDEVLDLWFSKLNLIWGKSVSLWPIPLIDNEVIEATQIAAECQVELIKRGIDMIVSD